MFTVIPTAWLWEGVSDHSSFGTLGADVDGQLSVASAPRSMIYTGAQSLISIELRVFTGRQCPWKRFNV